MADMSAVCTGFSMWAAFVLIMGVDTSVRERFIEKKEERNRQMSVLGR